MAGTLHPRVTRLLLNAPRPPPSQARADHHPHDARDVRPHALFVSMPNPQEKGPVSWSHPIRQG
jgi:hypothetical protein